ncbi:hypothetical protein [Deinococcus ruber]|uniref:Uncharacterized protein n=1 Tax=Deinococcus ruber TaxID=1848197 RepID=A0A918FAW1_9DEIO|nr:hypothetical protein [Deinococcus ruber]GGR17507.1 hypothetical protein GCM10008957_32810 [Deinococcus ruber]
MTPFRVDLTERISRYAKDRSLDPLQRDALYALKTQLIQHLVASGELTATRIRSAPWPFAQAACTWGGLLARQLEQDIQEAHHRGYSHAWGDTAPSAADAQVWLNALIQQAERHQRAVDVVALLSRGVQPAMLPLTHPPFQRGMMLTQRQRDELHPQVNWLIGFARPSTPDVEVLHLPWLQAIPWLPTLPTRLTPRDTGPYGTLPTSDDRKAWPLSAVLTAIHCAFLPAEPLPALTACLPATPDGPSPAVLPAGPR